jgi:hypothetical protein
MRIIASSFMALVFAGTASSVALAQDASLAVSGQLAPARSLRFDNQPTTMPLPVIHFGSPDQPPPGHVTSLRVLPDDPTLSQRPIPRRAAQATYAQSMGGGVHWGEVVAGLVGGMVVLWMVLTMKH